MSAIHQSLVDGRWFTLSLAEQLGNIGSEFERVIAWRQKKKVEYAENAFFRMMELLDLTIDDQRWHNHRLKELVRLKEVVGEELLKPSLDLKSIKGLQKYFYYFALAANQSKK
jgi:hypothetical protein